LKDKRVYDGTVSAGARRILKGIEREKYGQNIQLPPCS